MSNLIINGNFINPSITTNSILYSSAFTTDQLNAFGWTTDGTTSTSLQNDTTTFAYGYSPNILQQYVSIQNTGYIEQ